MAVVDGIYMFQGFHRPKFISILSSRLVWNHGLVVIAFLTPMLAAKETYIVVQRGIQSIEPLKALYISVPDRPVNSDTNMIYLGRIQQCCNKCVKTIHSQISTTTV